MNIFESLLIEQIEIFKNSYLSTSRKLFYDESVGALIHPGEFGIYRENIVKNFLRFFIPENLKIDQGFLINTHGEISTQCDIVIYDASVTPLIRSSELQRFFPVETACAIGEVKSVLSKADLKKALIKLSKVKAMREKILSPVCIKRNTQGRFDPIGYPYDQIATFLICQKLDFDLKNMPAEMLLMYEDQVEYRHRHNLILSIKDGIFYYYDENGKSMMYPYFIGANLKNRWTYPEENVYIHFKLFCSYIFLMTSSATILYPEITDYMGSITGGTKIDEVWVQDNS
ncbi:hypothetical protein BV378_12355 [Nostoc sp. RF31YmG]|jgi:hypothetical protein|nr:hypothetical protein BV378_12355 [Nostoc sp. RF31YmG]